jgi:serine/threonine protein kinase
VILAVKVVSLRKNKGKSSELLKEIKNVIDILKELDSPFVVKYIDFHATPENIYIVNE